MQTQPQDIPPARRSALADFKEELHDFLFAPDPRLGLTFPVAFILSIAICLGSWGLIRGMACIMRLYALGY